MTFTEACDAWLLPKLPTGEAAPSGPTQGLRRETDVERYLTRIDDDRPTNIYPYETRDEIYPTTPLQNPDVIQQDRVKVRAGEPDPFGETELDVRTPEAVVSSTFAPPNTDRIRRAATPPSDSTIEAPRPREVHERSLSLIAIAVGVLTLLVASGVIYLLWSAQQSKQEVVKPTQPTSPAIVAPAPKPIHPGPVIDLARKSAQIAVRDAAIAQASLPKPKTTKRTKAVATVEKTENKKTEKKEQPVEKPKATDPGTKKDPKDLSEDAIFGDGALRKDL